MELRHLRYFVAVGEEQHFGRAANRLHVVQPALSRQIRDLEHELGFLLFDRLPRGVRLSAAGTLFLNDARSPQATASACLYHLVMEGGVDPAMEPDERQVPKIAQAKPFPLCQRMAFRYGKDHPVQRELAMLQLDVPRRDRGGKAHVQSI